MKAQTGSSGTIALLTLKLGSRSGGFLTPLPPFWWLAAHKSISCYTQTSKRCKFTYVETCVYTYICILLWDT